MKTLLSPFLLLLGCVADYTDNTSVTFDVMDNRFAISIEIDGQPVTALLDSGSSELRVVSSAVPCTGCTDTGASDKGGYHSGLMVMGKVVGANIKFGDLATETPVAISLVAPEDVKCNGIVGCTPDVPFFGYTAILGVGMRTSATSDGAGHVTMLGSVLAQLPGMPSFEIVAPDGPASTDPGTLNIGTAVTPDGYETYQLPAFDDKTVADGTRTLPNGVAAWKDTAVHTCIVNRSDDSLSMCADGLLDTGNNRAQVEIPNYGDTTVWTPGTHVDVDIGGTDALIASYTYTIGSPPTIGLDETQTDAASSTATAPLINLGTSLFYRYDAFFDPKDGIVGLRARNP